MRPDELQLGIGSPITGEVALMGMDAPVSKPITSMWKRIKQDDQVSLNSMVPVSLIMLDFLFSQLELMVGQ